MALEYKPEDYEQYKHLMSDQGKATNDAITNFFTKMFKATWGDLLTAIAPIVNKVDTYLEDRASQVEDVIWDTILKIVTDYGVLDKGSVENLLKFKGLPFPVNTLFNIIAVASILGQYIMQVGNILGTPAMRNLMTKASPNLPREEHLIKAGFIAPERITEIRGELRKSGFSENSIDLMFIAAYSLYDVETVRNLYLRKAIDTDTMFMRMRELGFTDTRTKEIIKSWELIPGPSDLFHLVAKEAFEPGMIKHMGLDVEFPEEQVQWLEAQGLSRYWAEKYWAAHWDIPSIQQGFEMYHRTTKGGQTVINDQELDMLFRAAEIPPFWRGKLTQIAYSPYTRVDVRRMHNIGVLNEEEVYFAYRDLGFDHDKALGMLKFTIQYNLDNDRELTKSQIIKGYTSKILSKEEAAAMIQELDYSADQSAYILALEDLKEQQEYEDDAIDNIRDRFQGNLITEFEARQRLNALNLPAIKTDTLIDRWSLKVFFDRKLPSKTDLDKFLKHKIIDVDTYREEMTKLGYNFRYTTWYEKLNQKLK